MECVDERLLSDWRREASDIARSDWKGRPRRSRPAYLIGLTTQSRADTTQLPAKTHHAKKSVCLSPFSLRLALGPVQHLSFPHLLLHLHSLTVHPVSCTRWLPSVLESSDRRFPCSAGHCVVEQGEKERDCC
jgi:hypothetical protein